MSEQRRWVLWRNESDEWPEWRVAADEQAESEVLEAEDIESVPVLPVADYERAVAEIRHQRKYCLPEPTPPDE